MSAFQRHSFEQVNQKAKSHTPEKAKALETLVNVSRGLFVCTFIHKLVKNSKTNKTTNKKKKKKSNKILINTKKKNVGKPKYQEIETQRENGEIRFEKRTENVTKHTAVSTLTIRGLAQKTRRRTQSN